MKYFIANWKAHKNETEASEWCNEFKKLLQSDEKVHQNLENGKISIIICPPHPLLHLLKLEFAGLKGIAVGAQNISKYDEGNYTGEVDGHVLSQTVSHVIVGHSERRNFFNETNEDVEKKLSLADKYKILPILCLRNENDFVKGAKIIAFEPQGSIGTGKNESIPHILDFRNKLDIDSSSVFLYGGSVNVENVSAYMQEEQIDGLLVGTASLKPSFFYDIISGY